MWHVIMRRHSQERRRFLRQTVILIGGLVLAKTMGRSVWAFDRNAAMTVDRRNIVSMPAMFDPQSSSLGGKEELLLAALVSAIFPADGTGPSAKDVGVAEALAVSASASGERLRLYREGLARIEEFSLKLYAKSFAGLQQRDQHHMLHQLDHIKRQIDREPAALKDKILRKLRFWYYAWQGALPAADFWLQLQRDSIVAYYSHDLTWKWLGYAGPPFPNGYVNDLRT